MRLRRYVHDTGLGLNKFFWSSNVSNNVVNTEGFRIYIVDGKCYKQYFVNSVVNGYYEWSNRKVFCI